MTVRKLHFLAPTFTGEMTRSIDDTTHEMRLLGAGYIVKHRRIGKWYLVHGAMATAEVELPDEDGKPEKKGKGA